MLTYVSTNKVNIKRENAHVEHKHIPDMLQKGQKDFKFGRE